MLGIFNTNLPYLSEKSFTVIPTQLLVMMPVILLFRLITKKSTNMTASPNFFSVVSCLLFAEVVRFMIVFEI